ncbi:hypothetical protein TNCV_5116641 [Trichonephila clavipes]|nr:hypothetical protein TNCV_5116641 [Trichonephila clavipes]
MLSRAESHYTAKHSMYGKNTWVILQKRRFTYICLQASSLLESACPGGKLGLNAKLGVVRDYKNFAQKEELGKLCDPTEEQTCFKRVMGNLNQGKTANAFERTFRFA